MKFLYFLNIFLLLSNVKTDNEVDSQENDTPEGYYAFIQSPSAYPPNVRPPPYQPINKDCLDYKNTKPLVSPNNLCGDLNKGMIPRNPMRQNVMQEIYPFELIRNQTLKFLSKTLPILKADDTLPKVTQIVEKNYNDLNDDGLQKRTYDDDDDIGHDLTHEDAVADEHENSEDVVSTPTVEEESANGEKLEATRRKREMPHKRVRRAKKFCDGGGVFCALYRAIQGEPISSQLIAERREETINPNNLPRYEGPPTPCPAKVEYVTPVFAKNFQGSWRYVVQIPYEGYFTQTVEVTRCLQTKCHYLDGGCLSSPRWVSLLVAEIFYPNSQSEEYQASTAPPLQDFQNYQEYLQKRAGVAPNDTFYDHRNTNNQKKKQQQICDGVDEIGCFQIRLYYDWFLIPGSCKCWRPDYFAKYVKKRPVTPEL